MCSACSQRREMPQYQSTGKMGNMEHTRTLQAVDRYDAVGQSELKRGPMRRELTDWTKQIECWRKAVAGRNTLISERRSAAFVPGWLMASVDMMFP